MSLIQGWLQSFRKEFKERKFDDIDYLQICLRILDLFCWSLGWKIFSGRNFANNCSCETIVSSLPPKCPALTIFIKLFII